MIKYCVFQITIWIKISPVTCFNEREVLCQVFHPRHCRMGKFLGKKGKEGKEKKKEGMTKSRFKSAFQKKKKK